MGDYPNDPHFWTGLLHRIARRTRGRDDAEDLLHAAFIRLERYRAKHAVANPAAFLVQTAVNIGIDRHRHDRFLADATTDTDVFDVPDESPTQDEVIDGRARLERVKAGLVRLSPRTRDIFLMHRLDGVKYREIALRLGVSQSTVEKHIAKAALFLGEWMEGW
jgi:RNA polymerase sigma-70 factor (ECF subfamily)